MPDDVPAVLKRPVKSEDGPDDGTENFTAYLEYNRVLRTWFVAFGVGGPALFLLNDDIAKRLAAADELQLVAMLFLGGAALQVLGALINKIANWYVYESTFDEKVAKSLRCKVGLWLIEQYWIDLTLDLLTIGGFGYSAWLLLTVFGGSG